MSIRTLFKIARALARLAAAMLILLPGLAGAAVGIGEAALQSRPGEPLFIRVALSGERVEDGCLSLLAADPTRDEMGNFLSEANLAVRTDGTRQYAEIRSPNLVGDAPIRLRLKVHCAGGDEVVKDLTVAPSLAASPATAGGEEIAALQARQNQLETELSSVQQRLKALQEESGAIRLRLEQLAAASSITVFPPLPAASAPAPAMVAEPAEKRAGKTVPQGALTAVAGLVAAALTLWLGMRQRNRAKLRDAPQLRRQAELVSLKSAALAPAKTVPPLVIKRPPQSGRNIAASAAAPTRTDTAGTPSFHAAAPATREGAAEEDSLLEEAELYAASGRQARAVEILQEIIRRYPSKAEAWTLLLSLYSSLGKAAAFESTARDFLRHHKNSPAWGGIQALGRTLDHDNALYADQGAHKESRAEIPHQPIGDVLIEMGILSKRELLGYLEEFDPRRHGRFGGYLVARKAISISQLDQALLQQQGLNGGAKPVKLPSLQDIERFLSDFDPKRHGSVSEYMALHHAATPEELDRVLQQDSAQAATVATTGAVGKKGGAT